MRFIHVAAALVGSVSAMAPAARPVTERQLQESDQQPLVLNDESLLVSNGGHHKKPLVVSEDLQAFIHSDNLVKRAEKLYNIAKLGEDEYNHPTRVIGSAGHTGTLDYIYKTMTDLGHYYHVWNQSFPAISGQVYEYRLVLNDKVPKSASPMSLTPPTKNKQPVHGNLVLVANQGCESQDYPSSVEGNIAFILRGSCSFGAKSALAGQSGALAAVVYNYEDDEVHGTLGTPSPDHVATLGMGGKEAQPYVQKLQDGEIVEAIAYIDSEVNTIMTNNILAQTKHCDADNVVMLGGHSDSVPEGPGINDDGSGTNSLLEVATQLTQFSVNNCVRFAWWAGEEEGLLGSDYYVSVLTPEENLRIRLFMDYDMMCSPNFAYQVYDARDDVNPIGSQELRDLYVEWYEAQGLNHTYIAFDGRSDYDGFIRNGIPGGGIATGAEGIKTKKEEEMFGGVAGEWYDPCYHQLCDDVSNLNMTAWEVNTKLIAHSVATYARSLEGFPERKILGEEKNGDMSALGEKVKIEAYAERVKYHGDKLFM